MPIEYIVEDNYLEAIVLDGQRFETEDENEFTVPKSLLRGLRLEEIKTGIKLNVCEKVEDEMIYLETMPFSIGKLDNSHAEISFENSGMA